MCLDGRDTHDPARGGRERDAEMLRERCQAEQDAGLAAVEFLDENVWSSGVLLRYF
jgi:hypothetical protein